MRRAFLAMLTAVVALVGVSACSASSSGNKARPPQPPVDFRGHSHVDVDAQFNLFTPPDILITPGTTVTWHNRDAVAHNIQKATDLINFHGAFGVDAAHFGPGASYSFTFTTPGASYFYACTIHTGMSGRVEVLAGAGPVTTTVAP